MMMTNSKSRPYQICSLTVMDTSDPEIVFDEKGVSNHAIKYLSEKKVRMIDETIREQELQKLIQKIKSAGKNKKYDCLIGVSGGTDSTYVAYITKKYGLRPLAVHLDNGWNSELAVDNIQNTLKKLGIDLYTHVMDWDEFRDIQKSFLKASTPDMEIPTDHAINALLFITASQFGIRYILSGSNFNDEGVWPAAWAYGHLDYRYISAIHKKFGKEPIKTFPHFSLWKLIYFVVVKRIKTIAILNYLSFEKSEARKVLERELDWRDYGGKHNESLYTKFIQEYILPKKFGIDVRRPYLSAPILQGQITRESALEKLKEPIATESELERQRQYFNKKMGFTENDFEAIMNTPIKTRFDYPSNIRMVNNLRKLLNVARQIRLASS